MLSTLSHARPLNLASSVSPLSSPIFSFSLPISVRDTRSLLSLFLSRLVSKRIFFKLTRYSSGSGMSPMGCCTTSLSLSLSMTRKGHATGALSLSLSLSLARMRRDVVLTKGEATSGNSGRPPCRSYSECISGNRPSPESASMFSYLLMTRHVEVTTR